MAARATILADTGANHPDQRSALNRPLRHLSLLKINELRAAEVDYLRDCGTSPDPDLSRSRTAIYSSRTRRSWRPVADGRREGE
jgi:hypothetical protein